MSDLLELVGPDALAGMLALASAAADGAPIGLADPSGAVIAGRPAGAVPAQSRPILVDGVKVASIVGGDGVAPELLALVARSLELILSGGRDQAERVRIGHEMAIGRRIQRSLLPRQFPTLGGWSFAAAYEPAREVGGDLYDVFPLRGRSDRIGLLIADVTGKGIPAALLMADVRALLHAAADNADGPADALRRVNGILVRERVTSLFVTAALIVLDTATGQIRHASAGHEAPLVARFRGGVEQLEAAGPILGAFDDAQFEEGAADLVAGDALVLYTDGVTESRDERRGFYGEERLRSALEQTCGESAEAIRRAVVDDVARFQGAAEAFDDLTLLIVEREPPEPSP
jgi:sigma-B regulation protein RsbU (phosphoserine phosphatase)